MSEDLNRKPDKKKTKWVNPIRIFRDKLTDENLDEETARHMVNTIGVVGGLSFILVVVLVAIFFYMHYSSFSSQFEKAAAYEEAGDLAKAAGCYEKAIDAATDKEEKIKSRRALADLYLEQDSDTNAAIYLDQIVDIDPADGEAVTQLLAIYEENKDMTAILKLAKKASPELNDLFEDYLLTQPVFNYKSGTYDEAITVSIEAGENDRIYYTTDDTEATESSMLYTGPIQLTQGTTVFHAMAVSETGLMSENVVVNYEVLDSAPEKPEVSPESGEYRELTEVTAEIPDGCKAYYTLDGNVPTQESEEFKGSLTLPMGNHIFSLIYYNRNGVASEVTTRVYDFIFSAPVTKTDAIDLVRSGLVENGELADTDGNAVDGTWGTASFECTQILTINDTQYYRVNKIYSGEGPYGAYAVEIKTGAVFSLLDNNGYYTLVGF